MKLILALMLALIMAALTGCDQNSGSDAPKVGKGHNWDAIYDPTNGTLPPTPTETVL